MKNLLLVLAMLVPFTAVASDDQRLLFEVGIGFGKSGSVSGKSDKLKFCKNRNQGRMIYTAVRYSYDSVEAHVARWWHDDKGAPRCDRDSWAVGAGYIISTEGEGTAGQDDVYASWTPGVAYTWGENKGFTGQDGDNTNWRQTGNWQTFNRIAVGTGNDDYMGEVAVHRYGTWNPEHGEYFATVGLGLKDLDDNRNDGDRGLEQPPIINEGDTIINETTIINITDNSTTTVPEGYEPPVVIEAPETGNVR